MTKDEKNNKSFEQSFDRLETILEKLNDSKLSLDDSLTLFEEANELITNCDKHLVTAENKIETLLKNSNNKVAVDENSQPITEEFSHNDNNIFSSNNNDDRTV
jgi:exodeoxyribonuclease VII small subunit